ncbi:MAG: septal ring lytic transglycosylase RlpA family protein [bacterium]
MNFRKSIFYKRGIAIKNGIIFIIVLLLLVACSSSPRFANEKESNNNIPSANPEKYDKYSRNDILESVEGIASYYADKYHGRRAANGELFNMYEFTAAHGEYPFGTIIRVVDLSNNKSVIIRINDRFPYHPDRIIDLSYASARELDMLKAGISRVRLEILKWGK